MSFPFKQSPIRSKSAPPGSQPFQLNTLCYFKNKTPLVTRQDSDVIFMDEITKERRTSCSQPSIKTFEKNHIPSSIMPNIERDMCKSTNLKETTNKVPKSKSPIITRQDSDIIFMSETTSKVSKSKSIITRQDSDIIFMDEVTKAKSTANLQPSVNAFEKDHNPSLNVPNIQSKRRMYKSTEFKKTTNKASTIDLHLSLEDVSEAVTFDSKDSDIIFMDEVTKAKSTANLQPSVNAFEKDHNPSLNVPNIQSKRRMYKSTEFKKTTNKASTIDLHLSLEDVSEAVTFNSKDKSTGSNHVNEPKIKEAHLQFTKKLHNCNLISSPKIRKSQKSVMAPIDSSHPLTQESQDNFTKYMKRSLTELKSAKSLKNDEEEVSPEENKKEQRLTQPKKKRNTNKNGSNDRNNIKDILHEGILSQEEIFSLDSSQSLSQEVLNREDVKAAYVSFMNSSLEDDEDIKKIKAIQMTNMSSSEESIEDTINEPFETAKKTNIKAAVKNKKNCKRKNEKYIYSRRKKLSQEILSLDSSASLSQEVLNHEDVKAAYIKFTKSLENDENIVTSRKAMRTNENNVIASSSEESINQSFETARKQEQSGVKQNIKRDFHDNFAILKTMAIIHNWRDVGLYALCNICDKARFLPDVKDPLDLPKKWYCSMHPDKKYNKCSCPEVVKEQSNYLINNLYNSGSIVWAKMYRYPWWPAMVEDDVDTETYFLLKKNSNIPIRYHVTLFDSSEVIRGWLRPSCLEPFKINMNNPRFRTSTKSKYISRVSLAFRLATEAIGLPLIDRLKKYSFIYRSIKPLKRPKVGTFIIPKRRINEQEGNKSKKMKENLGFKGGFSWEESEILGENSAKSENDFDELAQFINNFKLIDAKNMSTNLLN